MVALNTAVGILIIASLAFGALSILALVAWVALYDVAIWIRESVLNWFSRRAWRKRLRSRREEKPVRVKRARKAKRGRK
jgi:hypothetical protein